jgi:dihydroneopterin aldolase/2-amino-4-hydroxy-6-hydroxymethyldihydropteridine diphosphokinase/dihydropteroate synthase
MSINTDVVLINNLQVQAITGRDYWKRPTIQPLDVTVELRTDFKASSSSDDLKHSLNYAVISRNIMEFFEKNRSTNFKSFLNIANQVSDVVLDEKKGGGEEAQVTISGRKTEIRSEEIQVVVNRRKTDGVVWKVENERDLVKIKGLKVSTIIGVFTFERFQKQYVILDMDITISQNIDFYQIIDDVATYVENSNFKTVEALIESVAQIVAQYDILEVTAKVEKPNAITFAHGVGVQVTRTPKDFINSPKINVNVAQPQEFKTSFNLPSRVVSVAHNTHHTAYIAFGSNVGNQLENILQAIDELNATDGTKVLATSSLYQSEPMYFLDQPKFINGVLKITTTSTPQELLKILKKIEYESLGRTKFIENGPRSIDLDILLYDDLVLNEPDLIIPHMRMIERTFVLQPLCELIPPEEIHPVTAEPYHNHLKQLYNSNVDQAKQKSNLLQVHVPLYNKYHRSEQQPQSLNFDFLYQSHRTQLMGILNTTPDSFSDGGKNANVEIAIENALKMVLSGVDIIDIGGVSTRPGSIAPDVQEEWNRVVPIVQAIRSHEDEQLKNVIISVDTYRASIALDSIKAGANIINDISGGLYDDEMFDVIAETGVPYVLNHTRGTPDTMSKLNQYTASDDTNLIEYVRSKVHFKEDEEVLLKAVARELCAQYQKAIDAGVKRWQIITDPGIGFAKDLKQNLAIIRGTPLIKTYSNYNESNNQFNSLDGLPILLGPSRKKFIGTLTNERNPAERVLTTGAVIMSCVGYGSDIVRVHDVEEVKKVLLIGDALYRDLV